MGHSQSQVYWAGNSDDDSLSETEFGDIEGRNLDTIVDAYLVNRSLAGGISRRGASGRF